MQRWTAIIADDDANAVAQISKLLSPARYNVIAITDPEAIGAAVKEHKRVLVLAAQSMRGLDASRLCEELHAAPLFKHVILLLERYGADTVTAAFEAGADDAIAKPLIPAELHVRLRHATRVLALEDFRCKFEGEGTLLSEIAARTSFHSQRYLQAQLSHEIARARRYTHPLALIFTQVRLAPRDDRFMRTFGHLLSERVRSHVDWIARYDQRSFALVLPETKLAGALRAAERLHTELLDDAVLTSAALPGRLTVNFGISALDERKISAMKTSDTQVLLGAAWTYLHEAAQKGPNRISAGPAPQA